MKRINFKYDEIINDLKNTGKVEGFGSSELTQLSRLCEQTGSEEQYLQKLAIAA